jgi:hypothetical protein
MLPILNIFTGSSLTHNIEEMLSLNERNLIRELGVAVPPYGSWELGDWGTKDACV